MRIQKAILIFLVILGLPCLIFSQTSQGGQPISFQKGFSASEKSATISRVTLGSIDIQELHRNDELEGNSIRVATAENVNLSLDNAGTWTTLANNGKLWRLEVQSDNSLGLSFLFKNMRLPEGGKLFVYSSDGQQVKGAYDTRNNKDSGKFMVGIIKGASAIIEYYEPEAVAGMGYFDIYKVFKVYDQSVIEHSIPDPSLKLNNKDFGDAASCHININCSQVDAYQEYKKGVARITMVFESAMGFCTGTLMNNVREDGTPYILTAFHCAEGAPNPMYDHWQFDFNYEAPGCENPTTEPSSQSIQGCELKAGREESDFLLVEIDENLPASFDVMYHGWDRTDAVPDTAIMVHHPQGDIMKFSRAFGDIEVFPNPINWNTGVQTPANHHFQSNLEIGAFETGSSGCAYIDQKGRVVGQLNGGMAACSGALTYIGRLFQSWSNSTTTNSLQPYLDPENTGAETMDRKVFNMTATVSIGGRVESSKGVAMQGVEVALSGDMMVTTTTDDQGVYLFEDLPQNGNYTITPAKNSDHFNGLSTGDLLVLRKEILGIESFTTTADYIAGDASNNQSISTADLLAIQRMILGINTVFPSNTAWRFYTSDFPSGLSQPNPFTGVSSTGGLDSITLSGLTASNIDLNFIGIKVGDTNFTADPNK